MSDGGDGGDDASAGLSRQPIDRQEMHDLLDRVLDLRERTDPATCHSPSAVSCGPNSQSAMDDEGNEYFTGKNAAALVSLSQLVRLFMQAGDWALNHKIGAAFYPELDFDDHAHEHLGKQIHDQRMGDIRDDRLMLRVVLDEMKEIFPHTTAFDLKDALEALEYGEVHNVFQAPVPRSNKWTISQHQLLACEFVEFLKGSGIKEGKAVWRVAGYYGVEGDTLRKWRSKLKRDRDTAEALQNAYEAGVLEDTLERDPDFGKRQGETIDGGAHLVRERIRDSCWAEAGREYKKAVGFSSDAS